MQILAFVDVPIPVVEAIRSRKDASHYETEQYLSSSVDVRDSNNVDCWTIYCASKETWELLERVVLLDIAAVALLERTELSAYQRALSIGASAVVLDTSSEVLLRVIQASIHRECLTPIEVSRQLANRAGDYEVPEIALSADEIKIIQCLSDGDSIDQIADKLKYSSRTVRRRIQSLLIRYDSRRESLVAAVKKHHGPAWARLPQHPYDRDDMLDTGP